MTAEVEKKIDRMIQLGREVARRGGFTAKQLRQAEAALFRVRADATPAQRKQIDRIRQRILARLGDEA